MIDFNKFYSGFLGLKNDEEIASCQRRSEIFSFYWKIPVIVTDYWSDLKASIHPDIFSQFKPVFPLSEHDQINDDLKIEIDNWFCKFSWDYKINSYLRYSLNEINDEIKFLAHKARLLTENDREMALSHLHNRGSGLQQAVWKNYFLPLLKKEHYFIVEKDSKRVSYAVITDIDKGGANIMVVTDPDYQRRGYGKAVVAKAIQWCLEHDVLPCFFHQKENTASMILAESLGFQLQCREIDVFLYKCEELNLHSD